MRWQDVRYCREPTHGSIYPSTEFMAMNSENLIWIDLEMTGLRADSDQIIEIATVITDKDLNIIAEGPEFAIHQPDEVLARMDAWNQRQHGNSGLVARVRSSSMTVTEAERQTLLFLSVHLAPG